MNTPPEDDATPGRDALTRAFMPGRTHIPWTLDAMRRMPDEWQGRMAELLVEYDTAMRTHTDHAQPDLFKP
jgi:hypothetical protein